jgi:hypothetical protein
MLGLKSTGWCGLNPWLTIYSILTSFFLVTVERAACFADLYRRQGITGCYSAETEEHRAAKLV